MDCREIIQKCKSRWEINASSTPEKSFTYFENTLPDFIGRFSEEEREIIEELLAQYDFFSHDSINTCLKSLHEKVIKTASITKKSKVVYCVLPSKNGRLNSSADYLSEYRFINRIEKDITIQNMGEFKYWYGVEKIVFVDDICGSGSTMETLFKKKRGILQGKSIIYAVVYAMKDSIEYLNGLAEKYGISLMVVTLYERDKVFKGLDKARKDKFGVMSKQHGIIGEEQIFGFKLSESVVSFYNNTPNNTLGLFSIDTKSNKALFPREKTVGTGWLRDLIAAEKKRKSANHAFYS